MDVNEFDMLMEDLTGGAVVGALPPLALPATRAIIKDGYVINPLTNRKVKATGAAGRTVLALHRAALVANGAALEVGTIGRSKGRIAIDKGVTSRGKIRPAGSPKGYGSYVVQRFERATPNTAKQTLAEFARDLSATAATVDNNRGIRVAFRDADDTNHVQRTIQAGNARQILKQLEELQNVGATKDGSDPVGTEYVLDTSSFSINHVVSMAGGGFRGISTKAAPKNDYFKLIDFSSKAAEGDCLIAVLRAVANFNGLSAPASRNTKLRALLDIPEGNIAATPDIIDRLGNAFGLFIRVIVGVEVPPDHERTFDDNGSRATRRNLCVDCVASPQVIASSTNIEAIPCDVYLADNHYTYIDAFFDVPTCSITGDIVKGTRTSEDIKARVWAQGRDYFGMSSSTDKVDTKVPLKELIIVYDFETIINEEGDLEAYALGYIVFDPLKHDDDFSGDAASVTQCLRRRNQNRYAVSGSLLDLLAAAPSDTRYTLVSFNGSNFDHFLLAQAASRRDALTGVFATASGGVRSLNIGRHTTLDIAKLVPAMSLHKACQGFKTLPTKQEGFSHVDVQREADRGTLYEWLDTHKAELSSYLCRDVLSESSLFMKLSKELPALSRHQIYGPKAVGTIGGHAWKMMEDHCNLPSKVKSEALDNIIRSAVVGGRVQRYNEEKVVEGRSLKMVDFVSLYPTAMAAPAKCCRLFEEDEWWGWYPQGKNASEPLHVTSWTSNAIGVYRITVHEQPPNKPNVIPRRVEGEPLEWGYRGEFECWTTHVDAALIRNNGGRITVHEGYIWPISKAKQGLFETFITPLASAKNDQDVLERAKDPTANPAMRSLLKLLMNSASGKTCQANYDDEVILAKGRKAQHTAESKMRKSDEESGYKGPIIVPLEGDTVIVIGKKKPENVYKRSAKPSILAVLIYAYSRALVWRTICQHNVLYSDTDSGLLYNEDYERLCKELPEFNPTGRDKELGDLEQELPDHARSAAFLIAPKDYAIFLYKDKDDLLPMAHPKSKIRCKGVNINRDRLIVSEEAVTELEELISKKDFPGLLEAYNELAVNRSSPLSDVATLLEYFKSRAGNGKVDVLTSQLTRSFKDDDKPFNLAQRYIIKHL